MSTNVKIVVAAVCLIVAAGIFYFTVLGGSGGSLSSGDQKTWFKCVNPDCNATYSLTPGEFAKLQGNNPMMPMMMPGQQQAFKCQKCGQQSAYMAQKCEKCGEVFIMQMATAPQGNQDYPDRCPKCGYSNMEAMEKQQE
jgi:predicted RNA-binding Zn-ribbon protein involved in translation (DUF1610 family)